MTTFGIKNISEMFSIGKVVLSDDIKENFFVCDLEVVRSMLRRRLIAGAPLEDD